MDKIKLYARLGTIGILAAIKDVVVLGNKIVVRLATGKTIVLGKRGNQWHIAADGVVTMINASFDDVLAS